VWIDRDLALRNLLLEINSGSHEDARKYIVKVADFGLSRFTTEVDDDLDGALAMYCPVKHRKPLPVRWLAPEAWYDKQFSSRSDVWAFGITIWELFSSGGKPYDNLPEKQVMKEVASGLRPKRPLSCPDSTFKIAQSCWAKDPAARPTFRALYNSLREELTAIEAQELAEKQAATSPVVPAYDEIDPYAMMAPTVQRVPSPDGGYKFTNDDSSDDDDDEDQGYL
jgi:serine/threonine protein kinase